MNDLEWLVRTSVSLGKDVNLVQGTGGNISVKNESVMMVKSSGVRMDAVSEGGGYTVVDHGNISRIYEGVFDEAEADSVVASSVIQGGRPSIETGFHSFLGKYVIHLHPVHLNVVLCCKNSAGMLQKIFRGDDFIWVPYVKVGHRLASEIRSLWNGENLVFLENHGIIISSDDSDECMKTLSSVGKRVDDYIMSKIPSFEPFSYEPPVQSNGSCASASRHVLSGKSEIFSGFLFPDAAVFSLSEKIKTEGGSVTYLMDYANAVNVDSVLASHAYIKKTAGNLGALKFLTEDEVRDILGMESEEYRRKMVGV